MNPLPFHLHDTPRVRAPSVDEALDHVYDGPVVITDAMDDYPLYKMLRGRSEREQLEALKEVFGPRPVSFTVVPKGNAGGHFKLDEQGNPTFRFGTVSGVTFDKCAELLARGAADPTADIVYLQSHQTGGWPEFAALCPAHYRGPHPAPSPENHPAIWIGSGGQIINLHYDWKLNFLYMFAGTKRVVMIPPDCLPDIYPAPLDRSLGGTPQSLVTLLDHDPAKYPRFAKCLERAHVATLSPGEILYIPPMWWHHVESFGLNVMVNTWLPDQIDTNEELRALIDVFRSSLATFEEIPPRMRSLWRDFFQFYLFRMPYEPKFLTEEMPQYVPRVRDLEKIVKNVTEATLFFDRLSPYWRSYVGLMYDYFVFRIHGDPYPTLPPGTDRETTIRLAIDHLVHG